MWVSKYSTLYEMKSRNDHWRKTVVQLRIRENYQMRLNELLLTGLTMREALMQMHFIASGPIKMLALYGWKMIRPERIAVLE